ncbi:Zinc carboxypeptidase A 1, partial [Gryllus bimaculatus]
TATYLINELLTSDNAGIRNISEHFDWYIVPSTNPDGYEYTHSTYRMWRKTRSPGDRCYGADPNRNWGIEWNNDLGSSSNECSETYRGKGIFSEPETKSLSEYLTNMKDELLVYLCFHSYSQVLMIPYGLKGMVADNEPALREIGDKAIEVLKQRHNTQYEFGPIYEAIKYEASGGSMDWVKEELKVKYTFEWELRDKGRYGFLLPSNQIIPTADETIDSIVSILQDVQAREANNS